MAATGCGSAATGAGAGAGAGAAAATGAGAGAGAGAAAATGSVGWCGLLRRGLRRRRHDGAIRAYHECLHPTGAAIGGVRVVDRRNLRRCSRSGLRRGHWRGARHRRHGDVFLPRHDALSFRLISILKPLVYELILVWKILATSLLGCLFYRAAVSLDHRGLSTPAHGAATLLVRKGESAAERDGAEQGAAHHENAAALQAKLARRLKSGLLAR